MALAEEIVGGGADFREIVDLGAFGESIAEAGQRSMAGDGGGGDGAVKPVRGGGGGGV